MSKQIKAVALISGGLDSMLAAKTVQQQNIHVEGINFFTGFCVQGHTHAIRKQQPNKVKRNDALWVAETLGIKLHIIDVIQEYKDVVLNPKHGYGKHLNPCLDCKIFMVNRAKQWLDEHNFDFIITGEVIGQRPKSQRKETMPIVAQQSGANDLLLRPLCAQNLPPTLPERMGWINRAQLHNFSGRSRKQQFALAEDFGFSGYAQPAGGCCFLTNEKYANKLSDLWQNRGSRDYELDDIMLLKVGRHLRPRANFKMIIGREHGENNFLEGYRNDFTHIRTTSHPGPLTLIDGTPSEDDIHLAAQITARYSAGAEQDKVTVAITPHQSTMRSLDVSPLAKDQVKKEWFI